jgi:DNA polymerase-1
MRIINTADLTPETVLSPDEASWVYNGLDCALTAEIYEALAPQIDDGCRETYELSRALQAPVLDMNMHGLLVDMHALAELKTSMRQQIAALEAGLDEILREGYGIELNWRSPAQLQDFLYRYLRLPIKRKRNANGGFSPTSDRNTLEELQFYVTARPAISYILALRDLAKALSFLDTEMDSDGRMRSNFNIAGTNTGRLSSSYSDFGSGTNLQNVGRALRRIFVAAPGKKLANLDLEQADSRNVGATCWNRFVESEGEAFAGSYLDACESGDLHTVVTKMARPELEWGDDPKKWRAVADQLFYRDKTYRDISKALGHGSNYLLTPESAVKKTQISVQAAREFQHTYLHTAFPCIPAWHQAVADDLLQYSCLTTIFNFRRFFFGRPDDPRTHRAAVAFEGQSPTASEINRGLLRLWRGGRRFPGFQLLCQVHDSVLFWYDEECEAEIIPFALEALRVPLILKKGREFAVPTEAKVGWNWGDASQDNPDGLAKWKGHDQRTRQIPYRSRYSFL